MWLPLRLPALNPGGRIDVAAGYAGDRQDSPIILQQRIAAPFPRGYAGILQQFLQIAPMPAQQYTIAFAAAGAVAPKYHADIPSRCKTPVPAADHLQITVRQSPRLR